VKLVDLRKLAIKKQQKIRFHLRNGMDCVMNERGVALVPGLSVVADFNLEQELESAATFVLEPLDSNQKNAPKPRMLTREELASMIAAVPAAAQHHAEHDDE
jgi:hypothetical protein